MEGVMDELKDLRREMTELKAQGEDKVLQQDNCVPQTSSKRTVIQPEAGAGAVNGTRAAEDTSVPLTMPNHQLNNQPTLFHPESHPSLQQQQQQHQAIMRRPAIPSSALPDIDIVPRNIRRDILQGKDVNLAVLLLPIKDRVNFGNERDVQIGDEMFTLKGKRDNRLGKDLTIAEFITAFNIFKRVICSQYPGRREELDNYISQIIEISTKFPGFAFYQYHLQFSAKSAEYFERGVRMDWASLDVTMLNTIVAGQKANTCSLCQAFDHTASFCGLNAVKPAVKESREQDICRFHQSDRGCYKRGCGFAHVCSACRSPDHKVNDPACPMTE